MSAFLVNNEQLSFIVTWAIDNGTLGGLSPQSWFKEFYQENVKSLEARYPDSYQEMIWWDLNHHRYIPTFKAIRPKKYSREIAIATIGFINCWEYQSCEHEPNPDSLPWSMMSQIKNLALVKAGFEVPYHEDHPVHDDPFYNKTPWCYDSKSWKDFLKYVENHKNKKLIKNEQTKRIHS